MTRIIKKGLCWALLLSICLLILPAWSESPDWDDTLAGLGAEELFALRDAIDARLRRLGEYPFVKLSEGSKGDEVTALQERLAELGYFTKEVNGKFQGSTVTAMKAFEKEMGLKRDGVASIDDQKALFAENAAPAPTPTPSPTPKPTRTPSLARDYAKLDYPNIGLMPEKYRGKRYQLTGVVLDLHETGEGLLARIETTDKTAATVMVSFGAPNDALAEGVTVKVYGVADGLIEYESPSGSVSLPLIQNEHLEINP
ncbi:MAG: peptidoglycan-binding protein [Clostridia bacterium]|nr:peptidoglycan-binding protein [Clostridia bacterium]